MILSQIILAPNQNNALAQLFVDQNWSKYLFLSFKGVRAKKIQERLHSVKINFNFEIAALFHHLDSEGKSAPISKLELFVTEWNRSYIVLALIY